MEEIEERAGRLADAASLQAQRLLDRCAAFARMVALERPFGHPVDAPLTLAGRD